MNKEKFINKLNEELDELKGKELLYFNMRDSVQEARCTNRIFGIQYALNCARLLDEPQKVKVKQFVADWFEEHKHNLSNSLWEFTVELNEKTLVTGAIYTEFESWFIEHPRAYEFITSMGKGYEVEEEPKYYLKLPKMGMVNEISNSQLCWTNCDGGITEKEIKTIDERYWPFAVPVEKV